MAESFEVNFNATDNISDVIRKIAAEQQKLGKAFRDSSKYLEQLSKDYIKSSNEELAASRKAADAEAKRAATIKDTAQQYSKLNDALSKGSLASLQKLVPADVIGAPISQIMELQKRLKEVGVTLGSFMKSGGSIIPKDLIKIEPVLAQVNELRAALGKPMLTMVDAKGIGFKQLFAEVKDLEGEINNLNNAARNMYAQRYLELASRNGTRELNQLKGAIRALDMGSSVKGFENVINFDSIRAQSNATITQIETLKSQLRALGPAAISGNKEAIAAVQLLEEQLNDANGRAKALSAQMRDAVRTTQGMLAAPNAQLAQFGYKPITVNDIFPTAEQQKLAQIRSNINAAVIESIKAGAVRDTFNSMLASGSQLNVVDENIVNMANHLPRLRYAFYDVSNSLTIFGAALAALPIAIGAVATSFQRDFADVVRTSGLDPASQAINNLKSDFIELAKTIPVSFKELTGIGQLAGQLGIASNNIASFTKNVAMFAATTDVTTNEAATAFGRLDQLISGVNGQYDKLGSSILAVGVSSVATESQIVRIAQQISSIANLAKFSASEVVGFSSALASVGTTPELSRGLFTRLFTEINGAVSGANENLSTFAKLAGQTADEFSSKWSSGGGASLIVDMLKGLSMQGASAEQTLRDLNIASVRDIPTVLKLAQGHQEVARQLGIAAKGWSDNKTMQDQYNIITSTVSEKIKILNNNFQALLATLGSSTTAFGWVIDAAIGLVGAFQHLVDNPFAGTIVAIGLAATGLTAVFALLAAGVSRLMGNFAGFATTSIELREIVATTGISFKEAQAVMAQMNGTMTVATVDASRLAVAMRELGIASAPVAAEMAGAGAGAAAAGAGAGAGAGGFRALAGSIWGATTATKAFGVAAKGLQAVGWLGLVLTTASLVFDRFNETSGQATKKTEELRDAQGRTQAEIDAANKTIDEQNKALEKMGGGGGTATKAAEKIRTLAEYANDLSSVFTRAFDIRFSGQQALDTISKSFSSIAKSTADASAEIASLNADISELTADKALQEYFLSVANAYGDTISAAKITANLSKINSDLASKNKSLASAQDKTNKTLNGNSDAAIENRSQIIGLVSNYQSYIKSLASSGMKQSELSAKAAQLKADFIAQATQLGYNETELQTYASAFDDVSFAISNVPRNVTIEADISPAVTALNEFVAVAKRSGADGGAGAASEFEKNFQPRIPDIVIQTTIAPPKEDIWTSFKRNITANLNTELGSTGNMFTELFRQNWTGGSNWGIAMPWYKASGGPIYGAGTSTSDSIPAMLSNGEYVINAAAVKQYGVGFFNQLNQMQTPRFFTGGPVSGGNSGGGIVSLSPEDRAILRNAGGSGDVVLYANNVELARSVNDGNRTIVAQGGRP